MRKVDPTALCSDLQKEIDSLLEFYRAAVDLMRLRGENPKKHISLLAEVVFHRGCVAVESFLSAWFVGCLNQDAAVYVEWLKNSIRQSISNKCGLCIDTFVEFKTPKHLSRHVVEELLDPEGKNVTFCDLDEMEKRAREWLVPIWASKISGIPRNRKVILNTARAIRNCIAHQSTRSFHEMNEAIKRLPKEDVATHLRIKTNSVKKVGSYLRTRMNGKSRVEIFFEEFKRFAGNLDGEQ